MGPEDGALMTPPCWKRFEIDLPASLSEREIVNQVNSYLRIVASEAGDFVAHIRIEGYNTASQGWRRWSSAYLPGPPAPWPDPVDLAGHLSASIADNSPSDLPNRH